MRNSVVRLLEKNIITNPGKIALKDEYGCVTYKEYCETAKKVGTYIAKNYTQKRNAPIAVLIDRNIKTIITFLGVAYSGNMYVPIDITMPMQRIQLIFDTLKPAAIIDAQETECKIMDSISFSEIVEKTTQDDELLECIQREMIDIDPLYAMFTSGSTGVPKGVCISHKSVLDLVDAFEEAFSFKEDAVFGNQAPFDFDVSVKDIYDALNCGGCVNIIPKKMFTSPALLIDHLVSENVNTLIWAVSALRIIADFDTIKHSETLPMLRDVFFSGEVMPIKTINYWRKHFKNTRFVNLYGPTEITCNCSYFEIDREFLPDEKIPIGKPFANTRIFLLSEVKNLVTKEGEIGEICVEGSCLALGYWNNEERTKASFAVNPFIPEYPSRIYMTGDLGYYDANHDLVFVGRKDHQIKHMGHRIELGEIENALNQISDITIAVCVYDETDEKIICFYQAEEERKKEIVKELSQKLPKYMWPNKYERYERLPLNKNGKIDRVLLKKEWRNKNGKNSQNP